jgi:hypothetical protein
VSEQQTLLKEITKRLNPAEKSEKLDNTSGMLTNRKDNNNLKFEANYENSSDYPEDQKEILKQNYPISSAQNLE